MSGLGLRLAAVAAAGGAQRCAVLLTERGCVDLATAARSRGIALPAADHGDDPILALLQRWDGVAPALRELVADSDALREIAVMPAESRLTSPLRRPGKILCIGLNYADHARETGQAVPSVPVLFAKWGTTVCGPGDAIVRPPGVQDLDYEAELGVIIGSIARDVPVDRALDHVAGYVCANDVSARTAQMETGQWVRGKSFDTFCPIGPALLDAHGVDPQALRITCSVDGETRQDSTTAQMVFGVAELVAYLSRSCTLEPGDLILTGTPPGVAMGRTPSPWLQPGQRCTVSIEHVGELTNPVVDAAPE